MNVINYMLIEERSQFSDEELFLHTRSEFLLFLPILYHIPVLARGTDKKRTASRRPHVGRTSTHDFIMMLSTALAKNHAKPAKGDTSHVRKMNIFRVSQLIMI